MRVLGSQNEPAEMKEAEVATSASSSYPRQLTVCGLALCTTPRSGK